MIVNGSVNHAHGTDIKRQHAHIAVASNFIKPMTLLAQDFENKSGHTLTISYASSGKIYAQIIHGAPFDVFLSADQEKPKQLAEKQLIHSNFHITYAIGKLVLWSNTVGHESPIERLQSNQYSKLALANPKFAPYGQAAVAVLDKLAIKEKSRPKWVLGESISQAYQFVASGNAEIGFIAKSQLPKQGAFSTIDQTLHPAIRQDAVLLKRAMNNKSAMAFFEYLQSNDAKKIIQSFDYDTE
ncbi:molybdate ABC transporter substrate-binding protein [Glaciecola sp. MH2013]|uniref:molybdate ABC transporter substrate-binding protein n=1 Tax=Glaciecola sp. MH2013 TaxID=2785524 RepID=UPI00189E26DD|nr:molybdate ABC transporter substrate-binding protein [Glaciecola sp. MH2013]